MLDVSYYCAIVRDVQHVRSYKDQQKCTLLVESHFPGAFFPLMRLTVVLKLCYVVVSRSGVGLEPVLFC